MKLSGLKLIILSFFSIFLVNCSETETSSVTLSDLTPPDSADPGSGSDPSETDDVPADALIFFRLGYMETGAYTDSMRSQKATLLAPSSVENKAALGINLSTPCQLSPSTTPFTIANGTTIRCNFKVPELFLYFRAIKFIVGTKAATSCDAIRYKPYQYKKAQGSTATCDSSAVQTETAGCWGGGGRSSLKNAGIENYPQVMSYTTFSSVTPTFNYFVDSVADQREDGEWPLHMDVANKAFPAAPLGPVDAADPRTHLETSPYNQGYYSFTCINTKTDIYYTIEVDIEVDQGFDFDTISWQDTWLPPTP